jgi:hypothetical protein
MSDERRERVAEFRRAHAAYIQWLKDCYGDYADAPPEWHELSVAAERILAGERTPLGWVVLCWRSNGRAAEIVGDERGEDDDRTLDGFHLTREAAESVRDEYAALWPALRYTVEPIGHAPPPPESPGPAKNMRLHYLKSLGFDALRSGDPEEIKSALCALVYIDTEYELTPEQKAYAKTLVEPETAGVVERAERRKGERRGENRYLSARAGWHGQACAIRWGDRRRTPPDSDQGGA